MVGSDGDAAVLFAVSLEFAPGSTLTVSGIVSEIVRSVAGGIAAGAVVTGALLFIAGRTRRRLACLPICQNAAQSS